MTQWAQRMNGRNDRIYQEAAALWLELFGEPLPRDADGETMLDMITTRLPDLGYDRMNTPHLRPTQICFPKGS